MTSRTLTRRIGAAALAAGILAGAAGTTIAVVAPRSIQHDALITIPKATRYVVLPSDAVERLRGDGVLTLSDDGAFLAESRPGDIAAWIGSDSVATLEPSGSEFAVSMAGDDRETGTNPHGADIWSRIVDPRDGALRLDSIAAGNSVVIAGDGTSRAPTSLTLDWSEHVGRPYAVPVAIGGGILALIGIVLTTGAGRRARPTNRLGRGAALLVVALVSVVAVDAHSPLPAEAADSRSEARAGATTAQIQRIVEAVGAKLQAADVAHDPAQASERMSGTPLALRSAYYRIVDAGQEYPPPAAFPVAADAVPLWSLAEATDTWPRRISVVLQTPAEAPRAPTVTSAVLEQSTARDPYRVTHAVQLGRGVTLPAFPDTEAVRADSDTAWLIGLDDLGSDYESILELGPSSDAYALVDAATDPLQQQLGYAYRLRKREYADKRATVGFTSAPGASDATGFVTADGGGLAWVTLRDGETLTTQPTVLGGELTLLGAGAALAGTTSSGTGFSIEYEYDILFAVPPEGSTAKVRVLGFTQGAVSASAGRADSTG